MHLKTKVFLSNSFADNNPVKKKLIKDLESSGNIILINEENQISGGDSNSERLSQAIYSSDYFIQIIGNHIGGNWANLEYRIASNNEAVQQKIKIIRAHTAEIAAGYGVTVIAGDSSSIELNFVHNYKEAFKILSEIISVNSSDVVATFTLNSLKEKKPIILIANEVNQQLINFFYKNPLELKNIGRRLFEELVAELFNGWGYEVELTQKTRDGGRDIIAIKNGETKLKYLIECKRPNPGNLIGIKPVRELFGVKQDEKATKAILVTTSFFTKDAIQFFERNKWELEPKDFNELNNWLQSYLSNRNID